MLTFTCAMAFDGKHIYQTDRLPSVFGLFVFFPKHTKYLIIYGQFLRARKICSSKSDFLKHCTTERFFERGYSEKMIDEEMS